MVDETSQLHKSNMDGMKLTDKKSARGATVGFRTPSISIDIDSKHRIGCESIPTPSHNATSSGTF